jgi:hypothetical protein
MLQVHAAKVDSPLTDIPIGPVLGSETLEDARRFPSPLACFPDPATPGLVASAVGPFRARPPPTDAAATRRACATPLEAPGAARRECSAARQEGRRRIAAAGRAGRRSSTVTAQRSRARRPPGRACAGHPATSRALQPRPAKEVRRRPGAVESATDLLGPERVETNAMRRRRADGRLEIPLVGRWVSGRAAVFRRDRQGLSS